MNIILHCIYLILCENILTTQSLPKSYRFEYKMYKVNSIQETELSDNKNVLIYLSDRESVATKGRTRNFLNLEDDLRKHAGIVAEKGGSILSFLNHRENTLLCREALRYILRTTKMWYELLNDYQEIRNYCFIHPEKSINICMPALKCNSVPPVYLTGFTLKRMENVCSVDIWFAEKARRIGSVDLHL